MNSTITITCHRDNIPERTYAINVLFHTLLGIGEEEYQIIFDDETTVYTISINDKCIIAEDHFFRHHPETMTYIDKQNIPIELKSFHALGKEYPIIYGEDRFEQDNQTTIIGLDIFASTFFMLTRWEEYALGRESSELNLKKYKYYQTDENLLFCVKNNLATRAFVHEYEFLLRNLLHKYGYEAKLSRAFDVIITHDVDKLSKNDFGSFLFTFKKYIKTKQLKKCFGWIKKNIQISFFARNRLVLFSQYINASSRYNLREIFLFKCCLHGEEECTYQISDKAARNIIKELSGTSAQLGFHPSQSTFNNNAQFEKEYARFVEICETPPVMGRNHRLVHNSNTIHQWEGVDVPVVSNYGYQRRIGFRCGIACAFPIFELYSRDVSKVQEMPFILMETAIKRYFRKSNKAWPSIVEMVNQVKKYQGVICMNWHVRAFTKWEFIGHLKLFSRILSFIFENQ